MKHKCSHKRIEWRKYKESKKDGDGLMPPTKYCFECEKSKQLKSPLKEINY